MPFIEWSSKYELGVPEMDTQHKRWIEMMNTFYEAIEGSKGQTEVVKEMKKLVTNVLDYTKFHFAEEEKLMDKLSYPGLEEQKRMHKGFVERMDAFRQQIEADKLHLSIPVTGELKNWLTNHIMVEDRKYVATYQGARK